jgi:hypothetical protein
MCNDIDEAGAISPQARETNSEFVTVWFESRLETDGLVMDNWVCSERRLFCFENKGHRHMLAVTPSRDAGVLIRHGIGCRDFDLYGLGACEFQHDQMRAIGF